MKFRALALATLLALSLLAFGGGFTGTAVAANAPTCTGTAADFDGGDGSEGDPYEITDVHELQCVGHDAHLDGDFVLTEDVNASETADWNDEGDGPLGFDPIAESTAVNPNPFEGSFDGGGHVIDGLTIDRDDHGSAALFGHAGGEIMNVALTNVSIEGEGEVGGLVGDSFGLVSNASVSGEVTGSDHFVGGLVGQSNGEVSNSWARVDVEGSSTRVGGLIGESSDVSNSWTSGNVDGDGEFVGGLVGRSQGQVTDSWASGSVNGEDASVGGLVGEQIGGASIENSSATGDVSGDGESVGGLVGLSEGAVSESSASGDVTGDQLVGGLVGQNDEGEIANASASGTVEGVRRVGGLVGQSPDGSIATSFATGDATGIAADFAYVGGLVGENGGTVERSFSMGDATGTGDFVGGLVGDSGGAVTDAYAFGDVTGDENVGGLVGRNSDSVTTSFAVGSVNGNALVGGLIGDGGPTPVTDSYWDEEETGQDDSANGTALATAEMQGVAAEGNLMGFDFGGTWALTDGYPHLASAVEDLSLALDETDLDGGDTTDATVTLGLVDGSSVTSSTVADYASSDADVATADDGTVDAHAAGDATITASHAGLSADAALSVEAQASDDQTPFDPPIPAISIAAASLDDASIEPGDTTGVSVTLANEGDGDGTHEVALFVDGEAIDSTNVFVAAGGSRTISFGYTSDSAGEYTIVVDETTVGTLVVAEEQDDPSPEPSPPPDGGPPTDTEPPGRSASPDGSTEERETTAGEGPGFAPAATVLAIAVAGLLASRRARSR